MTEEGSLVRRLIGDQELDTVAESGYFSAGYYALQSGLRNDDDRGLLKHYLCRGEKHGLKPSPWFDPDWYRSKYPDVGDARSPLLHFVEFGELEGRWPNPLFDPAYYTRPQFIGRPLRHFVSQSPDSRRAPHPILELDVRAAVRRRLELGANWVARILSDGTCGAELPPFFDGRYYATQRQEDFDPRRHNIVEFLKLVEFENVSPHVGFDVDYYLTLNEDVRHAGCNAFLHYLYDGRREGRKPHPTDDALARISTPGSQLTPCRQESPGQAATTYDPARVRPNAGKAPSPLVELPVEGASATNESVRRARLSGATAGFRLDAPSPDQHEVGASPLISILMPVYRPGLVFLDRAIRSVLLQRFTRWQLCVVDDGSRDPALDEMLEAYASSDDRICVAHSATNGGISRATNAACDLATANFVGLLDQDDLLARSALDEVSRVIDADRTVDWVYSDECLIDANDVATELFGKPDWSPTLLLSTMYTGHFSVYRRRLVQELGGFRPAYDLSQDYDLALRVAETQPKVVHLQKYLYGWRSIPGSAAQGGKPAARRSNIAALQAALDRRRVDAVAVDWPTSNRVVRRTRARAEHVSIIIPSDDPSNILEAVRSIRLCTRYAGYEIIVVTSSRVVARLKGDLTQHGVRYVNYDKAFNFSDKCNAGAAAAKGTHYLFFNDDVRARDQGWLEALLDGLALGGVGAVGPRLLYEDGGVQHAGMVTGVRNLIGTAFHTYPANADADMGMPQFAREVSLLSGACLLMSAENFWRIGGFDDARTPINHSDVDLCLRLRATGLSCVYIPFATLTHYGHRSLGDVEAKDPAIMAAARRADNYVLRRWPAELIRDPYFPRPMREVLYRDSQEHFEAFAALTGDGPSVDGPLVLIVSHDLSNSGAPKVALDLVSALRTWGCHVWVASPSDGPMRERMRRAGAHVVVDDLIVSGHPNTKQFAMSFDLVIANTSVTWPVVESLGPDTDILFYIHEGELIRQLAGESPGFLGALKSATRVLAASPLSIAHLSACGHNDVTLLPPAVRSDDLPTPSAWSEPGRTRIGVFGSFEPRKGQDLAVMGLLSLPPEQQEHVQLRLFGRVLDERFARQLRTMADGHPSIHFGPELAADACLKEIASCDAVLIPSRDDPIPLVSLEAMALGRVLIVSKTTGTSEWLQQGVSAHVLEYNTPENVAQAISATLARQPDWTSLGQAAKECFESEFDWRHFEARLRALLAPLLPEPARHARRLTPEAAPA